MLAALVRIIIYITARPKEGIGGMCLRPPPPPLPPPPTKLPPITYISCPLEI